MESSSLDRHRRKLCGHCNEMLSYSAYRSHKDLYYDQTAQSWITEAPRTNEDPGEDPMHEIEIPENEDFSELLECDATGHADILAENLAQVADAGERMEQDELFEECLMDKDVSDSSSEHEGNLHPYAHPIMISYNL